MLVLLWFIVMARTSFSQVKWHSAHIIYCYSNIYISCKYFYLPLYSDLDWLCLSRLMLKTFPDELEAHIGPLNSLKPMTVHRFT